MQWHKEPDQHYFRYRQRSRYRRSVDANVCFSNRPFEVKRFQAIRHCSVDVARGLVLLFGIGTKGPCMGFSLSRRFARAAKLSFSVSWFDLKARFFVPTCASLTSMRAESVQGWLSPQPCGMLRPCQAIP